MFRGEQLSRELARIQQRLDSVELLSLDIIVNLLLSYRDVQVGDLGLGGVPGWHWHPWEHALQPALA